MNKYIERQDKISLVKMNVDFQRSDFELIKTNPIANKLIMHVIENEIII
jgi:hypothetical protein